MSRKGEESTVEEARRREGGELDGRDRIEG